LAHQLLNNKSSSRCFPGFPGTYRSISSCRSEILHFAVACAFRLRDAKPATGPSKGRQTVNCPPASGRTQRRFHPRHLFWQCVCAPCSPASRSPEAARAVCLGFSPLRSLPRRFDKYTSASAYAKTVSTSCTEGKPAALRIGYLQTQPASKTMMRCTLGLRHRVH
jgi:hypothetical protein